MDGSVLDHFFVGLTFDFESEFDFFELAFFAVVEIGGAFFEGAYENVFEIGDSGGESPGGIRVVADDDAGDAGDIHAGDFQIGSIDGDFVNDAG